MSLCDQGLKGPSTGVASCARLHLLSSPSRSASNWGWYIPEWHGLAKTGRGGAQPSDSKDREVFDDGDATESIDDRGLAEGLEDALLLVLPPPSDRSFLRVHRLTSCLCLCFKPPLVCIYIT